MGTLDSTCDTSFLARVDEKIIYYSRKTLDIIGRQLWREDNTERR
jgi:hypothetical protein